MLRSANKYRCEFFDSTALPFTLKIKVLGAEKTILFVMFFLFVFTYNGHCFQLA